MSGVSSLSTRTTVGGYSRVSSSADVRPAREHLAAGRLRRLDVPRHDRALRRASRAARRPSRAQRADDLDDLLRERLADRLARRTRARPTRSSARRSSSRPTRCRWRRARGSRRPARSPRPCRPSSSEHGTSLSAHACATLRPVATLPVKTTRSTSALAERRARPLPRPARARRRRRARGPSAARRRARPTSASPRSA